MQFKADRPLYKPYPKELKTLGDHLKKARLDRGLSQTEVAEIIGTAANNISTWETNSNKPTERYYPSIFKFLGYNPFFLDKPRTLGMKFKKWRIEKGLTMKQVMKQYHFDLNTLKRVESDDKLLRLTTWEKITRLITSF